jgi:HK97 family phage prohead protease
MERRFFEVAELRAVEKDDGPLITGYAALFNVRSVVLWGAFREVIEPGAFAESIAGDDIRALWQHDTALVLGRSKAGTLTLSEDERGLRVEIAPPDTQAGRDAVTSIRRGDVDQMSFGMSVLSDGESWREEEDGTIVRRVRKAKLWEVSPVTFAAYPQTEVGVRSLFGDEPTIPAGVRGATATAEAEQRALREILRRRLDLAGV